MSTWVDATQLQWRQRANGACSILAACWQFQDKRGLTLEKEHFRMNFYSIPVAQCTIDRVAQRSDYGETAEVGGGKVS